MDNTLKDHGLAPSQTARLQQYPRDRLADPHTRQSCGTRQHLVQVPSFRHCPKEDEIVSHTAAQ